MKTINEIWFFVLFLFHSLFAHSNELVGSFTSGKLASYKVRAFPVANTILYDANFVLPSDAGAYTPVIDDEIDFESIYSGDSEGGNNGYVYYGIYQIEFWNATERRAYAIIDFRDADYIKANIGLGKPYVLADFYVDCDVVNDVWKISVYNNTRPTGGGCGPSGCLEKPNGGDSFTIWDLAQKNYSNQTAFKNLTLSVYGNDASATVTVTAGATNYLITGNNSISANNLMVPLL